MLKWGQMLDFVWWPLKKKFPPKKWKSLWQSQRQPINALLESRPPKSSVSKNQFSFLQNVDQHRPATFFVWGNTKLFVRKYKLMLWGNTNLFRKEIRTYVLRMRKLFRKEIQIMPWGNANFSNFISTQRDREEGFDISAYMTLSTAHWYSEYSPILRPFPNISNDISNLSHFAFRFCSNFARIFCLFKLGIDC